MTAATLTRTGVSPAPRSTLKPSLSACYQGGYATLNIDRLSTYKKTNLNTRMQRVWDKAVKIFNADTNSDFRVNLTDLYITQKDPANAKERFLDIGADWTSKTVEEQDFQKEVLALRDLIMGCYRNIRGARAVGGSMNRPQVAGRPFQSFLASFNSQSKSVVGKVVDSIGKSNYPGRSLSEMPLDAFLSNHFNSLASVVSVGPMTPEQSEQRQRVIDGDTLAENFSRKIRELIIHKEKGVKDLGNSGAGVSDIKADLASLRKLEKTILERNRYALYCSLALAETKVQMGTQEDRQKNAKEIGEAVNNSLLSMYPTLKSELVVYSREVGDLVLHDPIEYFQRVESDNREDPANSRSVTGPSIEEFFTHIMVGDLPPAVFDVKKSLDSLGIFFGIAVQREIETTLTSLLV